MGFQIDRYFPTSGGEWQRDMRTGVGWATEVAVDAAKGVGDTALGILTFLPNTLSYITGTDSSLGEGNPIFSSKFGRHYRQSDWVGIVAENPVYRTVDVAAHMLYGAADLVTAHLPHTLFNEKLELNIPYFSPPVTTVRGAARDISMIAVIAVTPALKGRVVQESTTLEAPPRFAVQPKQSVPLAPAGAMVPAYGLLSVLPGMVWIGRWVSDIIARVNPFSRFNRLATMISKGKGINWNDPANYRVGNNPRHFAAFLQRLIEAAKTNTNAVWALHCLARARPELFTAKHIPGLLEVAKGGEDPAAMVLNVLARAKPELFIAEHILRLIEVAKTNGGAAWVLYRLAQAKSELLVPQRIRGLNRMVH